MLSLLGVLDDTLCTQERVFSCLQVETALEILLDMHPGVAIMRIISQTQVT